MCLEAKMADAERTAAGLHRAFGEARPILDTGTSDQPLPYKDVSKEFIQADGRCRPLC
jgi:hypothetical protein